MRNESNKVLLLDDQKRDIAWLLDLIGSRRYSVVQETNERAARRRLEAVQRGSESYRLAIIDIMMATHSILDLPTLDRRALADSRDTGIRLCRYARRELLIPPADLPIIALTIRDDEDVRSALRELGVPYCNRAAEGEGSIRQHIEELLPMC